MKLDFKDIIGKHTGQSAIVAGMGPSLGKHIDKIKKLKNNGFVIISCNDVDVFTDLDPDYWCLANETLSIAKMYQRINKKNATILYADSVDLTPHDDVNKLLFVNYIPYDQRHFDSIGCAYKFFGSYNYCSCQNKITGRLAIQEEFNKYTNYNGLYIGKDCQYDEASALYLQGGGTVAIPMLLLAVLLGCENIYVSGIDLNYSKGHVNGFLSDNKSITSYEINKKDISMYLNEFKMIKESAKHIGTNIYCVDNNLHISNIFDYRELL